MKEGEKFDGNIVMCIIECYSCHVPFAVTSSLRDQFLSTGVHFFCPNGHSQHYSKSTEAKLREELKRVTQRAEFWEEQESISSRSLSATRGVVTKLRNKIVEGKCPVCSQSFKALSKHMAHKHPDYEVPDV
jgi:hypothetical protein